MSGKKRISRNSEPFSWHKAIARHENDRIKYETNLARTQNPDFKIRHEAECRDVAKTGRSTELITRVKKECKIHAQKYATPQSSVVPVRLNRFVEGDDEIG